MGWAKYDEDNRDYIEERWEQKRNYYPTVFNYTSGYSVERRNASRSNRTKYSAETLKAYAYANYTQKARK